MQLLNEGISILKLFFTPPIIAHRGASLFAPENTLAAFSKAKDLNLKWVEFDVMLAATGEAVVIHDEDLHRTTNGHGKVIDSSYEYLKTLDAGSWWNPHFSNQRIPLLQDVLTLLHQEQLAANIEIKALPGYEEATVQRIVSILEREANTQKNLPLLISSFSPKVLKITRKLLPSASLGVLIDEWQPDWQDSCEDIHAAAIHINHSVLTPDRINRIKEKKYSLLAYTVNTLERAHALLSSGVDAIFSDCPEEILTGLALWK